MKHSRHKTLSFSCFIPSWEHKNSGTATEQFCSQWTAGSNNKHLANCGIWAEINEQHNYSMEVLLWLENLEATDCVLVPPGHPRLLDGFCLPFQPAFSLRQKEQDGEGFVCSAIVSILLLSQAVSQHRPVACPLLIQPNILSFLQKAPWTHEAVREWSKAPFILLANNRYYIH